MIEREKERKYAHERANGNDEIARVKITCGGTNSQGPENSELQTKTKKIEYSTEMLRFCTP